MLDTTRNLGHTASQPRLDGANRQTLARALAGAFAVVVGIAAFAPPAHAELIANGSFATGLASWITPGAPAVSYSIVTSSRDGSSAAQVTGRLTRSDAPRQNVTAALIAGDRGRYRASLYVEVAAAASVRCFLNLTDATGMRQLLMAEQVVRTPAVWLEIAGTQALDWTDPLGSAVLTIEVEKLGEGVFPDVVVDDVSIEVDQDGDGITDPAEGSLGTNPTLADSDGDGLPDGFEWENGLDPLTADAEGDPDRDGFSNRQENGAATAPLDPASFPGIPSNPAANARARSELLYLALVPSSDACVLAGQHISYPAPPLDEYALFIDGLYTATGQYPAVLAMQYDDNANPLQVSTVNPYALAWAASGGLVEIKWSPRNPWTGGFQGDRSVFGGFADILTAGSAANLAFTGWLDEVAAGLSELRDAGVVVLWRPMSEMNGGWFWWGRRDRQGYIDLWHYMYARLTGTWGLDNLLWVYESDAGVHQAAASDYYYPGDDVTDVMGHNLYHDTFVLPFDLDLVYRRYPKVNASPQAGPNNIEDGTWSNLIYLDGNPSGAGGIRNRQPRMSYFAAWNGFWTWDPVLMMSVYKAKSIVDNREAFELMNDPCVITRDSLEIPCEPLPPAATLLKLVRVAAGTSLQLVWSDATAADDHVVLEDGAKSGGFAVETGSAVSGATGLTVPMPAGDFYYRVAGRNACGAGPID